MKTNKQAAAVVAGAGRLAVILSYDMVSSLPSGLRFPFVVADEAHTIKNGETNRAAAVMPLIARARRCVLATGTPVLQRPVELHTLLSCLMPGDVPGFEEFTQRYCDPKPSRIPGVRVDNTGASCLPELNHILLSTVMVRRLKEDALELPEKTRAAVPLALPPSEMTRVEAMKARIAAADDEERRALSAAYFALTGRTKVRAVSEHIAALLARHRGEKVLVFAHHEAVLDALVAGPLSSVRHMRIDGKVSSSLRDKNIHTFQTDPGCRVALLSITAAGVGITLTAASRVVFAELNWTPGLLRQCEDRAHRIGQTKPVHVQYLIAAGTLDEVMWKVLENKLRVSVAATQAGEARTAASAAEVEELWAAMRAGRGKRAAGGEAEGAPAARQARRLFTGEEVVDLTSSPERDAPRRAAPPPQPPRPRTSGETVADAIELD